MASKKTAKPIRAAVKDDLNSLCEHIEGHIAALREALAKNDRKGVWEQASEIEACGQSLRQTAVRDA